MFRRLFAGRLVTNAGDSLYYIAAMWLVYDLGGSAFYTGLAGALILLPQALQFLTGPLVDRWSLRRTLVGTQVIQGVLLLIVPLAAATGWLTVTVILIVIPVAAMINQFVYPAQSAALPRIVEKNELVDANSAFSVAYSGVDFVFTAFGGILIALVGAVSLYLIDSVTFAVAALVFAGLHVPNAEQPDTEPATSAVSDYFDKLSEGIQYIRATVIVPVLGTFVLANIAVYATIAVLPVFADARGGSGTYGMLLAGISVGIFIGALAAPRLKSVPMHLLGAIGYGLGGVAWLAAIQVQWLPLTTALICLAAIPLGVMDTIVMAMIQSLVPERLVGRVTAVTISTSGVAKPVGSMLGGIAAESVGINFVMAALTIGLFSMTVFWIAHPLLRHVPAVDEIDPAKYGLRSI